MADAERKRLGAELSRAWLRRLREDATLASAVEALRGRLAGAPALVLGGAVRSAWSGLPARDVDVAVDCHPRELAARLRTLGATVNSFGGFKVVVEGVKADVWPLLETWALKHAGLRGTFEDLVTKSTMFDVEAAGVELHAGLAALDGGMVAALESGVLGLRLPQNPFPVVQVARAARFCRTHGLRASDALLRWMLDVVEPMGDRAEKAVERAQRAYWGQARVPWEAVKVVLAGGVPR